MRHVGAARYVRADRLVLNSVDEYLKSIEHARFLGHHAEILWKERFPEERLQSMALAASCR